MEIPPVLEVSGAKEGSTKPSICKRPLRDRLGDGTLPRPSEAVQPVDGGPVEVADPKFDLVKNCCTRSSETTIAVAMSIPGLSCTPDTVEDSCFGCGKEFHEAIIIGTRRQKMIQPGSCEERLFRLPKRNWKHLLLPLNLDCWKLSVASSASPINGEKSVRS